MRQVIRRLGASRHKCFFWATHAGAELDMLVVRGNQRLGFEFKRASKPTFTQSMAVALETLGLKRIDVIFPGNAAFPLAPRARAIGIECLTDNMKPLL